MLIDTSFDFRVDARGKDPDSHSPTLRKYHRRLWSRPLPGGDPFELRDPPHPGRRRLVAVAVAVADSPLKHELSEAPRRT